MRVSKYFMTPKNQNTGFEHGNDREGILHQSAKIPPTSAQHPLDNNTVTGNKPVAVLRVIAMSSAGIAIQEAERWHVGPARTRPFVMNPAKV